LIGLLATASVAADLRTLPVPELQARVKAGDAEAMVQLASRYTMGTGVPVDNHSHGTLLERAAAAGSEFAKGYCARYGRGQPRNKGLAFELISKAAARGEPLALCQLADCYMWGSGTKRDLPKAYQLFQQAAESGEPEAVIGLYRAQFGGVGIKASREAAHATLLRAKDSGSAYIANHLADDFWTGFGCERDEAQAEAFALLALKGDLRTSFDKIIETYAKGPGIGKANDLYRRAGEQGDAQAWLKLADNHAHGRGTEQNPTKAHEFYLKAGDLGDGQGYYLAALDYQNGRGVEPSEDKAKALLEKAAALDSKDARIILTRQGPPSPVDGEFVALAQGIQAPKADATPAERFLHQLARITTRYLLDTAYRPSTSSTLDDLTWAEWRANSLVALLQSPIGNAAPADLRAFCKRALDLDAAYLLAWKTRSPPDQGKDGRPSLAKLGLGAILAIARDIEADAGRTTQPWLYSNTPANQNSQAFTADIANNMILPAIRRVEKSNELLQEAKARKQRDDLHKRWAELLTALATTDATLKPYATDPRITDPSWHFATLHDLGEAFFGQCITNRGEGEQSDLRRQAPSIDFGDLTDGPIVVHIKSSVKGWAFQFGYNDKPSTERKYVLTCTRGHIGAKVGMFTGLWSAQGMTSWGNDAQAKFAFNQRTHHLLSHLPITGSASESEVEGTLLIYLTEQFPTAEAALAKARHINLFDLPLGPHLR
jgi:TPR repeat protein